MDSVLREAVLKGLFLFCMLIEYCWFGQPTKTLEVIALQSPVDLKLFGEIFN